MKVTKAPGLMKYPYTIEATEEEFRAIRNAVPEESNQGYTILKAETCMECDGRTERVVLGRMVTRLGAQYVTWESISNENGEFDYYWGHYFDDYGDALHDYYKRLMERFE